jgi:hypothetical protein
MTWTAFTPLLERRSEPLSRLRYRAPPSPPGRILPARDSSGVAVYMTEASEEPVRTFTIAFPEAGFHRFEYSKIVAEKYETTHQEVLMEAAPGMDTLEEMIPLKDAPLEDPTKSRSASSPRHSTSPSRSLCPRKEPTRSSLDTGGSFDLRTTGSCSKPGRPGCSNKKPRSASDSINSLRVLSHSEEFDAPKWVLKKAMERVLPDQILHRKKVGFPVSLTDWIVSNLADTVRTNVLGGPMAGSGVLGTEAVEDLVREEESPGKNARLL